MGKEDLKWAEFHQAEEDPNREESINAIDRIVQTVARTAERYIREEYLEKAKEVVENLQKFKLGCLSLMNLHDALLEKDRVGGVTETFERLVPFYLTHVEADKFRISIPVVPEIQETAAKQPPNPQRQSPIEQEQNAVEQEQNPELDVAENSASDSFNHTLAVVPRTQPPSTARKFTRYAVIEDMLKTRDFKFSKLDVLIQKYSLSYLNVLGQVISVYRTKRSEVMIRYWDGTPHKTSPGPSSIFHVEDDMIVSYYSSPRGSLEKIPKNYYVDIDVYGEFMDIAKDLRSGDIIAIVNLHVFKSKKKDSFFQITLHEGGGKFNRAINLLHEEELVVVQMKEKYYEIAEGLNSGTIANGGRKMNRFFNNNEQQEAAIDIQQADREVPRKPSNASEPTSSSVRNATEVFKEANRSPKTNQVKRRHIVLSDESDDDEIQQPKKKLHVSQEKTIQRAPSVSSYVRPERAERPQSPDRRDSEQSGANKSAALPNAGGNRDRQNIDLDAFFRKRLPSPKKRQPDGTKVTISFTETESALPTTSAAKVASIPKTSQPVTKSKVKVAFVQVKPATRTIEVQTDEWRKPTNVTGQQTSPAKSPAKTKGVAMQTSPIKEPPKKKGVNVQTSPIKKPPKKKRVDVQTSPMQLAPRKRKHSAETVTRPMTENSTETRDIFESSTDQPEPERVIKSAGPTTRSRAKILTIKSETPSASVLSISSPPAGQKKSLTQTDGDVVVLRTNLRKKRAIHYRGMTPPPPPPVRQSSLGASRRRTLPKNQNPDSAPALPPHGRKPSAQKTLAKPKTPQKTPIKPKSMKKTSSPTKIINTKLEPEIKPTIVAGRSNTGPSKDTKGFSATTSIYSEQTREEKPVINNVLVSPAPKGKVTLNKNQKEQKPPIMKVITLKH